MKANLLLFGLLVLITSGAYAYDAGYAHLPTARFDVNNDGRMDYCRFVGNEPEIFIACDVGTADQYAYKSIRGIDKGYENLPREFKDVNRDGYGDYCRCVGNSPFIFYSCNLGKSDGFDSNQYTLKLPGTHCKR